MLQQKTFNEPLYRCADQAWLSRYDGARETRAQLLIHQEHVQAACSPHERAVFRMLLTELDGYAMVLQSLLLRPRKFELRDPGVLAIDPAIRSSCEDRRLAIKSLAMLLLHPLDDPLREEAVRFMGAETDEERKMIVHRLEGEIRRHREVVFEKSRKESFQQAGLDEALEALTASRPLLEFRASSWDLDRFYYYLVIPVLQDGRPPVELGRGPQASPQNRSGAGRASRDGTRLALRSAGRRNGSRAISFEVRAARSCR
jgi:hypothetical protein